MPPRLKQYLDLLEAVYRLGNVTRMKVNHILLTSVVADHRNIKQIEKYANRTKLFNQITFTVNYDDFEKVIVIDV